LLKIARAGHKAVRFAQGAAYLYRLGASDPLRGMDVVRIGVALIILMHPLHHPDGHHSFLTK
jgi:hypothetical protein